LGRVLVASADADERGAIAAAYRVTGNIVVEAPDAGTCLEILEKQPPDALVLDPRLPGLAASQLLRHLRRSPAGRDLKVSLLAHDMDASLWEFLGRQFFDVVVETRGEDAAGELAVGTAPGKGRRGPKTRASRKSLAAPPAQVRRILVVEDEPMYCLLLASEFQALGWSTVRAGSAEEGLAALEKEAVDAVLSDINLPKKMGNDLAFEVRKRWPGIKVILMTGMSQDRYPKVPPDVPVLPKPISVKELMAAMRFLRQG
jgi:DNA-binding response OmpR family regulator